MYVKRNISKGRLAPIGGAGFSSGKTAGGKPGLNLKPMPMSAPLGGLAGGFPRGLQPMPKLGAINIRNKPTDEAPPSPVQSS